MVEEELGPSIGDRITKNGKIDERGSVRYVGPVEGQKGTWVGIEWDNTSRGRHNGTIEGKTYFQTEHPTGGSFIKANVIDGGRDLLDQIRERYEINDNEENEKMGGVTIEKIGMNKVHDRQKNIFYLGVICLAGMRVSSPPPKLTPHFINCTELNLHGNLLHRWKDVFEIINFFPKLKELALGNNIMENLADVSSLSNFPIVTAPVFHLVLNYCKVTETTISAVLSRFPNVTDLYASGNRLTTFNPGQNGQKLRLVDLELNPVKSLEAIDPENFMENLENLSLQSCNVVTILGLNGRFRRLTTMNLKGNPINEWASINSLADLERLQTLFVTSTHFEGLNGLDVREMVIAKLSKLTMLNRGDVSAIERRSAELRFISKCNGLEETLKAPHENDIKRLIQIHGEPVADNNKAKKINVVKVSISYQGKSLLRPLPTSSTVSKVIEIAARLFALDPKAVTLWIEPKEGAASKLSIPARQLSFYSVETGDTIRVEMQ